MTILNACVWRDVALVAVDTDAFVTDGGNAEISKFAVLAHCPAIIAGRGDTLFLTLIQSAAMSVRGDFDRVVEEVSEAIPRAYETVRLAPHWESAMAAGIPSYQDVLLVGWSPSRGRMIGKSFRIDEDELTGHDIMDRWSVSPGDEVPWGNGSSKPLMAPDSAKNMHAIACIQARFIRNRLGRGGRNRLIVAGLELGRMFIEDVGEI